MVTLEQLNARLQRLEALLNINAKDILTVSEASDYTGYSQRTLYNLSSQGKIATYRAEGCRRLYFRKDELYRWMTASRRASESEIERAASRYIATHRLHT